jgi:VIT1/CCC1 family predicted Fe2+/Mn2+ transporter
MPRLKTHDETHLATRIGWLRAAVLGANDGIISTASLIVGVAAATPDRTAMLIAGVAGLVAGAMSMAAGEYVSVSSQADTEKADLARETRELKEQPEFELNELADIYVSRGLEKPLALEVAKQLMAKDALGVHAREELGITEITAAQPVLAAITSAITFAVGAAAPLLLTIFAPLAHIIWIISGGTIFFLAILGALGAHAGGANLLKGAARVTFWGAVAMAATALIGKLVGHSL